MKTTKIVFFMIAIVIFSTLAIAEDNPPSLTDFQQFYGSVTNLPTGTFTLQAVLGEQIYTTPIAMDSKFGYTLSFKVYKGNLNDVQFFVVDGLGGTTLVGSTTYQNQAATELTLQYPSPETRTEEDSDTPADLDANETVSGLVDEPLSDEIVTGTTPTPQSTTTPTPITQRPARTCTPGTKRCFGAELKQCSTDGSRWSLLQTCSDTCNSLTLNCEEPPETAAEDSSLLYLIGGIVVVLLAIIILLFLLFKRKKYTPLRKYISNAQSKGFSRSQIRSRLINQGWDPDKVDKMLK